MAENTDGEASDSSPQGHREHRDTSLYKVGDEIRGEKIGRIYRATNWYILFGGQSGGLAWLVNGGPTWKDEAIKECGRLRDLARTYLTARRQDTVDRHIATALASALSATTRPDLQELFSEAASYIDKYKDEIASEYGRSRYFVVYRLSKGGVAWEHKNAEQFAGAIQEFNTLQSLIHTVLPNAFKAQASDMLGIALTSAFRTNDDGRPPTATAFKGAREFIESRVGAKLRTQIFATDFMVSTIVALGAVICYLYTDIEYIYLVTISCGVAGAMISSLRRLATSPVDPFTSERGLIVESISRMLVGALFGGVVVALSRSGLMLEPFRENPNALAIFAVISGFSERFVPDLLTTISEKSSNSSTDE